MADMTVGLPQSTWSIAGTSGIEGNLPVAAMSAAKGFFDTTCNLTQGIWGFGSGIKKCDTGNCIVNPLLSAFPGLPNGFALMLCGPRTGAGSYQTGGGHVWLGGADSNFMAEPFTFLSMFSDNITTSQGTTFNVGFFEANATAILVNGNQVAAINWSPNSPVILDSGTTAIILPDPLFQSVTSAMEAANFIRFGPAIPASQQAKFWSGQDYLILPCNQVYIGNSTLAWQAARPDGTIATISIDPTTVIKVEPVACSSSTDYANSTSCLRVALQMQSSGAQAGVTILGVPVLQGYVVFFDRGNSRVGFAKSIGCASGLEGSAQGINVLAGPAYVAPTVTIKVSPPVYGNNLTCFGSGDWPVPTFTSSAAPAPTGTASGKPNSATGKEVKRIAGISLLVMAAIGLA